MRRGIGRLRAGGSGSFDSEAVAWAAAVTSAGGTYTANDLTAMSQLIAGLKADGIWTKLTCFGPVAGVELAAALVQYKSGAWAQATNVNFVGGDYSSTTGLTGNGSTKYIDTGLLASGLSQNSLHMMVYNRSSSLGSRLDIAASSTNFYFNATFTDGKAYTTIGGSLVTAGALATPYGMLVSSRTGAALLDIYKGGVNAATNTAASAALPAANFFVHAMNNGAGVPTGFSTAPCGAYSVGAGLSAADALAYNTRLETFEDALGRGVQ